MCVTPLFFFLWGGKKHLTICTLAGAIYTYRSVRVSLFWVTSFALVDEPGHWRQGFPFNYSRPIKDLNRGVSDLIK